MWIRFLSLRKCPVSGVCASDIETFSYKTEGEIVEKIERLPVGREMLLE
jgi:hypothetical protein